MTLQELIAKLESADKGSDALDREIAKVCGIEWSSDEDGNYGPYDITPTRIRFTRSHDAAVTLIPPDRRWDLRRERDGLYPTRSFKYSATVFTEIDWSVGPSGLAYRLPTAELAVCVAALKARLA